MNKTIILILILCLPITIAADPSITNITYPTETLIGTTENITTTIDSNGTNGKIWLYLEGNPILQQDFNSTTNTYIFQQQFNTQGTKNIEILLSDFNTTGNNSANDSNQFQIEVFKGIDFKVTNVAITPNTLLPDQNIVIDATIQNIGDKPHTGNIQVFYYYDGLKISEELITNLTVSQIKNVSTNFQLPNNFAGTHTISAKVNPVQTIPEFAYTNNEFTKTISDTTNAEIVVDSITKQGTIRKNELANFETTISNIGGTNANSLLIKIYHTTINEQSKIYETTLNTLSAYSTQDISFSYAFPSTGTDKIIVYADPLNNILEQNENNNTKELDVTIEDTNTIFEEASTLFFNVYSECVTYISNGDRFVVNSIDSNGSVNFTYYDNEGKTVFQENNAKAGYEKVTPGRTIRIVDISNGLVKMFLVYQQSVSVQYTSCDIDLTKTLGDLEQAKKLKQDFEQSLESCIIERDAARKSLSTYTNSEQQCQADKSETSSDLQLCLSSKIDANNSFWENKYLLAQDEKQTEISNATRSAIIEKENAVGEANIWKAGLIILVLLIVGYGVWKEFFEEKFGQPKGGVDYVSDSQ